MCHYIIPLHSYFHNRELPIHSPLPIPPLWQTKKCFLTPNIEQNVSLHEYQINPSTHGATIEFFRRIEQWAIPLTALDGLQRTPVYLKTLSTVSKLCATKSVIGLKRWTIDTAGGGEQTDKTDRRTGRDIERRKRRVRYVLFAGIVWQL